ncbi:Aminoglycoside phosphotransferase [Penicillium mononematosum]|uniref:Aminoglycoside phosphotransferase n=1 Tax=Penicillium mononematosum TaxID=268346 RepID=UPI002549624B|nr:Aminoglycoside phosphotransferase [Penicillium mononematosum]KAJ6181243.1 Aminoglycoside phosphotransferase [Penicillium mononematosum]
MPLELRSYGFLSGLLKTSIPHAIIRSLTTSSRVRVHGTIIPGDVEEFYRYSAQKWLWNEPAQLLRRYLQFDMDAFIHVAEEAAGDGSVCGDVTKLPEGNSNKVFLVTMQDGRQLIVKLPNPNAGPVHYTTASEVATMQFVRNPSAFAGYLLSSEIKVTGILIIFKVREKLHIPAPKVLRHCSRASESKLGVEYIVMEKAPGVELGRIWEDLKSRDKLSIVKQTAAITCTLAQSRFPYHGALYRKQDVSQSESFVLDDEFAIGPTTGPAWFDNRRAEVEVHRGPWISAENVMKSLVQRETACLEKFPTFPRDTQQGIFGGPSGYHPTKEAKLSVLRDFLKICPHLLPRNEKLCAGVIWHNDLHMHNIFVDSGNPSQITSIIDWQGTPIYPMFLVCHHPSLIEYEGPELDGFAQPVLPDNIRTPDPEAKKAAKDLFLSQETLSGQLMGTIGSTYDDREPYVQSLLADITEDHAWKELVGEDENGNAGVLCPLSYSKQDMAKFKTEYAKWEKDVERKTRVLEEIGVYVGWNGAASPNDYDEVVRRLAVAKQNFLARESANNQERAIWESVWPFQDAFEGF